MIAVRVLTPSCHQHFNTLWERTHASVGTRTFSGARHSENQISGCNKNVTHVVIVIVAVVVTRPWGYDQSSLRNRAVCAQRPKYIKYHHLHRAWRELPAPAECAGLAYHRRGRYDPFSVVNDLLSVNSVRTLCARCSANNYAHISRSCTAQHSYA